MTAQRLFSTATFARCAAIGAKADLIRIVAPA
jgi:hypothetical protein